MRLNTGAISQEPSFGILAGTRSGQDAFAGSRLFSSFFMTGAVNSMSLKKLIHRLCLGGDHLVLW